MMEKISIIVPIYNSEKYLEDCLTSLVEQTYTDLEIILVNDGSTDQTTEICRQFARKCSNIKLVEISNSGRVRARKEGLKLATGRIVAFMDSDDWIEINTIENMYKSLCENNADIVIAGYYENTYGKEVIVINSIAPGVYKGNELSNVIYDKMLCDGEYFHFGISPFLVNKLYRREIIEDLLIDIDDSMVVGEDVLCVYPAILRANTVSIVKDAYYHYRIHTSSTMHSYRDDLKEYQNIQLQQTYLEGVFKKHPMKDSLLYQLERYIKHHQMVRCLPLFNELSQKGNCFPFQEMEKGSNIIIYGAGAFGVATHQFFISSKEYNVIGWCDRDYVKYQSLDYDVEDIKTVLNKEFDYIVIAIMNKNAVENIKEYLMRQNVLEKKVIWLSVA